MEMLLNTYIATFISITKKEKVIIHDTLRTKVKLTVKVEKCLGPKATVVINFYGDSRRSHNNQIHLNALQYSRSSVLRKRIKEEKSDVYNINVNSAFSRLHNQYSTKISFTYDPNRIEELVTEIHKAIEKLKLRQTEDKYVDNYIAQKLKQEKPS
jgi:zinc protease